METHFSITVHDKSMHATTLKVLHTSPAAEIFVFDCVFKPRVEARTLDLIQSVGTQTKLGHVTGSKSENSKRLGGIGEF
jgi:hypothetical protein